MAAIWEEILAKKSAEEWYKLVVSYTLPEVIALLGRLDPPTFDELINLPWIDTADAGTYLHMLTPMVPGHHNHL